MTRALIMLLLRLAGSTLGLLAAAWLVDGVSLSVAGFIIAVAVYTAADMILAPFVFKMTNRHASAFLGGVGLISTLVSLWIAALFPGGITVSGFNSWILAALVVWLVSAVATVALPAIFLRNRVAQRQGS